MKKNENVTYLGSSVIFQDERRTCCQLSNYQLSIHLQIRRLQAFFCSSDNFVDATQWSIFDQICANKPLLVILIWNKNMISSQNVCSISITFYVLFDQKLITVLIYLASLTDLALGQKMCLDVQFNWRSDKNKILMTY